MASTPTVEEVRAKNLRLYRFMRWFISFFSIITLLTIGLSIFICLDGLQPDTPEEAETMDLVFFIVFT